MLDKERITRLEQELAELKIRVDMLFRACGLTGEEQDTLPSPPPERLTIPSPELARGPEPQKCPDPLAGHFLSKKDSI